MASTPPMSRCEGDHVACKPANQQEEDFWDAYVIVALVCFILGALLLIAGFIRLIWYFTKPRKRWKIASIQSLATSSTDVSRGFPTSSSKLSPTSGGVEKQSSEKADSQYEHKVLRYLESKPDGKYICPDFDETPALWY